MPIKQVSLTPAQKQLARSATLALVAGIVAAGITALYQYIAQGVVDLGALINVATIVAVALFGLPLKDYTPDQIVKRIDALETLIQDLQQSKTVPLPEDIAYTAASIPAIKLPPAKQ